jgi:hypothetical protein
LCIVAEHIKTWTFLINGGDVPDRRRIITIIHPETPAMVIPPLRV